MSPPRAPALAAATAASAALAACARIPLLWDDPWAPGYDGWYYVLQTRSWMEGAPLFSDRSLVFPILAAFGRVVGDVVVGNKVATCVFAALGAAGATLGAARWTGSLAAGLVAGTWWAVAPDHLAVSTEFLKNEAGLAVLGLLLAALAHAKTRGGAALALLLVLLGPLVHKLTGIFGLVLGLGVLLAGRRPISGRWMALLGLAGVLLVGGVGLLREVDLGRFLSGASAELGRMDALLHSRRIHPLHRLSLGLAHLLPVGLAIGCWQADRRALGLPLTLLSVAVLAPALPFGFDLTSWRLLLMAFVPMAFGLALATAHRPPAVAGLLLAGSLLSLFSTVPHHSRSEPNYGAWAEAVPLLQEHIPEDGKVVAHRGLCGFVAAVADRHCENFDPVGSPDGWWRIAYGMGEARLAPYSDSPPVRLMLGYTLVSEEAWRAFRGEHADDLPLLRHPRNPHEPRPGFVYGPQEPAP